MDVVILARKACLSAAQVRQLENKNSNDSLFYSPTIKRQAYKRLLMILGAEPPPVKAPEGLHDAGKVAAAQLETLDQIVAMSHQPPMNRTFRDVMREFGLKVAAHKQFLASFFFLIGAILLYVWNDMQQSASADDSKTATPLVVSTVVATTVAKMAEPIKEPLQAASIASSLAETAAPTVVASAALPAIPVTSAPVLSNTPVVSNSCEYTTDTLPQASPWTVQKEGRYVYLVSSSDMKLCVVDGKKQATMVQLKAGESRSIYGPSPWQLSGSNLQKVQIYFQGGRVVLPDVNDTRLQLVEKPLPN